MMTELAHERLDAYKASIDFLAIADEVSGSLPKGRAYLADQLRRAATSIALNIAEGAGEFAAREKARFYRMARRSATECGAVLDVCARLGLGGAAQRLATGKALAHRIVSMLTVLVKRLGVLDSAGTGTGARERGEARSGKGTGTGTFTGGGDSAASRPFVDGASPRQTSCDDLDTVTLEPSRTRGPGSRGAAASHRPGAPSSPAAPAFARARPVASRRIIVSSGARAAVAASR